MQVLLKAFINKRYTYYICKTGSAERIEVSFKIRGLLGPGLLKTYLEPKAKLYSALHFTWFISLIRPAQVYECCFAYMYICPPHACLVLLKIRREHQIP